MTRSTKIKGLVFFLMIAVLFLAFRYCTPKDEPLPIIVENFDKSIEDEHIHKALLIKVHKDITVGDYFQYIDSIVKAYDSLTPYPLSEHLLIRSNPWIIDTLKHTDYYHMMALDSFVLDQKTLIVLPQEAVIVIPDSTRAAQLLTSFSNTLIDVNIPEFKLRIYEDSTMIHEFSIRVGKNQKKFLTMAGRTLDLKTKTGKGTIVAYNKQPDYYNPVDGRRYFVTRRDDHNVTKLPQIPFIETKINGVRDGQLIHPTTNPVTLGKPASNGCIGTKESDAWVIYYYAPIGTKINIRYNLNVTDSVGQPIKLKDIYDYHPASQE